MSVCVYSLSVPVVCLSIRNGEDGVVQLLDHTHLQTRRTGGDKLFQSSSMQTKLNRSQSDYKH